MYETVEMAGWLFNYRPGTTDIKVLEEVIRDRCYRRAKVGFDVEPGEKWLDLGANIGAFAVYANHRGARTDSFEPEPGCYAVLRTNKPRGCNAYRAAVTAYNQPTIPFFTQKDSKRQATASVLSHRSRNRMQDAGEVANVWVGGLGQYDGVKMDIEGSEMAILDQQLLPVCEKLTLEYHSTVDRSIKNMRGRIEYLRSLFDHVYLEPEMQRALDSTDTEYHPFFDRQIFCWGRK